MSKELFRDLVRAYIDDLVAFLSNFDIHLLHLRKVFLITVNPEGNN